MNGYWTRTVLERRMSRRSALRGAAGVEAGLPAAVREIDHHLVAVEPIDHLAPPAADHDPTLVQW